MISNLGGEEGEGERVSSLQPASAYSKVCLDPYKGRGYSHETEQICFVTTIHKVRIKKFLFAIHTVRSKRPQRCGVTRECNIHVWVYWH